MSAHDRPSDRPIFRISIVGTVLGVVTVLATLASTMIPLTGHDSEAQPTPSANSSGPTAHAGVEPASPSTSGGPPRGRPTGPASPSGRETEDPSEYRRSLRVEREAAYRGSASTLVHHRATVGKPFPLTLAVCGPARPDCEAPDPFQPVGAASSAAVETRTAVPPEETRGVQPGPEVVPPLQSGNWRTLGPLGLDGRVRAELTAYAEEVEISATGHVEQVISSPEDVAQWRWAVRARVAGEFHFQISVTALKGETDTPLFPTRYFDLLVDVDDTVGNRAGAVWDGISRFLIGAGSGMATLGGTIIAYLAYRQGGPARHRRARQRPTAAPAGAAVSAAGPGGAATASRPRRAAPRPEEE